MQEVAYDTAGRLIHSYEGFCRERGVPFAADDSVLPPDGSTLFCSAGMQRFKPLYRDPAVRGTRANVQACLRLNDLGEVGDGTHLLAFDMLGLFSFREMDMRAAVGFWLDFLGREGVVPDEATVHPERMDEWAPLYAGRVRRVRPDPDCVWSDGGPDGLGGLCTELHVLVGGVAVEIGNIVRTGGDCVDAGFGLQRLLLARGHPPPDAVGVLADAAERMLRCGVRPGPKGRGYALRRVLREIVRRGGVLDRPELAAEAERQARLGRLWARLEGRHRGKPRAWWLGTHGIDPDDMED